jgi:hypothetical protein
MIKLSWIQLLSGVFAIAVTMASAGFTLGYSLSSGLIAELRLQLERVDRHNGQLQASLDQCKETRIAGKAVHIIPSAAASPENDAVTITSPSNGSKVPNFIDVAYSLNGDLPSGYKAILVVRDPIGQYWSWGSSSSGRHYRVQIGTSVDSGREFEIGVLITNQEFPLGKPRQKLPGGIAYESITVRRE